MLKLSVHESATIVIDEVCIFWQKAQIPTRKKQKCIEKLEKLYKSYTDLQKSAKHVSTTQ